MNVRMLPDSWVSGEQCLLSKSLRAWRGRQAGRQIPPFRTELPLITQSCFPRLGTPGLTSRTCTTCLPSNRYPTYLWLFSQISCKIALSIRSPLANWVRNGSEVSLALTERSLGRPQSHLRLPGAHSSLQDHGAKQLLQLRPLVKKEKLIYMNTKTGRNSIQWTCCNDVGSMLKSKVP